MDVDMMKSSSSSSLSSGSDQEVHIDMMTMMMQMEKQLPDFCDPNFHYPHNSNTTSSLQEIHFSNGNTTPNTITLSPIYQNTHPNSPTLLNPSTTSIPFLGTPIEDPNLLTYNNINYKLNKYPPPFPNGNSFLSSMEKKNSTAAIREMIFRVAAMQPIHIDPESVKPPKRRNVKISKDPQSVAARHRRERISERIRILQRLVPGGTKMDTASMLDEAIHYVKFLKKQVQSLEQAGVHSHRHPLLGFGFCGMPMPNPNLGLSPLGKTTCQPASNMMGSMQML